MGRRRLELPGSLARALGYGEPRDFGEAVKLLVAHIPSITMRVHERSRDRICRDLLDLSLRRFAPIVLDRVVVALCLSALESGRSEGHEVFRLIVNLLRVVGPSTTSLQGRVRIAEAVCRRIDGLTFKPFLDGSAHWTIYLDGDLPLTCTVAQIDDDSSSWLACMILAFVLQGVSKPLQDLLGRKKILRRSELSLLVVVRREFVEMISKDHAPSPETVVTVSRATDEEEAEPPPINIILSDSFDFIGTTDSHPSPVEELCMKALDEGMRHLLRGKVHESSMRRAIIKIILGTIS